MMRVLSLCLILTVGACAQTGAIPDPAHVDAQYHVSPPVHLVREVDDTDAVCRPLLASSDARLASPHITSCTYANPIPGQPKIEVLPHAFNYWFANPSDTYARIKACEDEWVIGRPGDQDATARICTIP